jgi:hypothetical protein
MSGEPDDRPTVNGSALAAPPLVGLAEISVTRSLARRACKGIWGDPSLDSTNGAGELSLSAPRLHGELLMLGVKVSQATVSRSLRTENRRPAQSWRTFVLKRFPSAIATI